MWQGQCRWSDKPDETKTIPSRGSETISPAPHQKIRMLDEPAPDEVLDDWMISGPATEHTSSD